MCQIKTMQQGGPKGYEPTTKPSRFTHIWELHCKSVLYVESVGRVMLCVYQVCKSWNYYILAYRLWREQEQLMEKEDGLAQWRDFWERPSTGRLQIMATLNTHSLVLIVGTIIINIMLWNWFVCCCTLLCYLSTAHFSQVFSELI